MSRDYREKEVEGVIGDIRAMLAPKRCKVTVRMTTEMLIAEKLSHGNLYPNPIRKENDTWT